MPPQLRARLPRYAQLSSEVIAQNAACNGIHLIEQRCARWLLVTAEAIGRTNFNLTQWTEQVLYEVCMNPAAYEAVEKKSAAGK